MKKMWIVLVFVCCLSLTSCSMFQFKQGVLVENEFYTVSRSGGSVSLVYHKAEPPQDREIDPNNFSRSFSSLAAMYDYMTEDEIYFPDSPDFAVPLKPMKVFDVGDLKEPLLPEGWEAGECRYTFAEQCVTVQPERGSEIDVEVHCFFDKEAYLKALNYAQEDLQKYYYSAKDSSRDVTRYSQYYVEYEGSEDCRKNEMVHYTFRKGLEKRDVFEWYKNGEKAPYRVEMFGKSNGSYMMVSLKNMTEAPSKETLREFGLKPYGSNPVLAVVFLIVLGVLILGGAVTFFLFRKRKAKRLAGAGNAPEAPAEGLDPPPPDGEAPSANS